MKEVILKRITIDHWRGQTLDVVFDGNTNIYGKNKVGKSTIFNAFLWVLTGADSQDRSNFQLFDNRLPMTYENAIPAKVEVLLSIDGCPYQFSRVAQQSWSRKRGESEHTKDASDNYSFFLDNIEVTSKEYKNRVEEMFAPINLLKIILNIKQMFSLDWKVQREAFSSISGEISEEDFKGNYADLFKELQRYSMAELEARIKTISDPLVKTKNSLPKTIETLIGNLPDISMIEDAKKRIAENEEESKKIDAQLQGLSEKVKPYMDKRNEELGRISTLKQEISEQGIKFHKNENNLLNELRIQRQEIVLKNESIERQNKEKLRNREKCQEEIRSLKEKVSQCVDIRERLLKQRDEIMARKFVAESCSYCGQLLPEEKLEELKDKFLKQQQQDKDEVVKKGKANNVDKERYTEQLSGLAEKLKSFGDDMPIESLEGIDKQIQEAESGRKAFEDSDIYKTLTAEIKSLEENLTIIPKFDNSALINMRNTIMQQIKEDSELIGLEKERKKQEDKIEEYRKQLKDSLNELAVQENLDFQLKAYRQEYADLVSQKINNLFERVKVEMMQQNKSGAWIPSCTITTDGVQSTVYNKAESILSGIDISNAFMCYFGLNMPLFIDDAESISKNNQINTDRQLIKLIVSNDDNLIVTHE